MTELDDYTNEELLSMCDPLHPSESFEAKLRAEMLSRMEGVRTQAQVDQEQEQTLRLAQEFEVIAKQVGCKRPAELRRRLGERERWREFVRQVDQADRDCDDLGEFSVRVKEAREALAAAPEPREDGKCAYCDSKQVFLQPLPEACAHWKCLKCGKWQPPLSPEGAPEPRCKECNDTGIVYAWADPDHSQVDLSKPRPCPACKLTPDSLAALEEWIEERYPKVEPGVRCGFIEVLDHIRALRGEEADGERQ